MKTTMKVEGLAALEKALLELPKSLAKAVEKRVLTKAAGPIKDAAQQLVHERTGRLKRGITISTKVKGGNKGGSAYHKAIAEGASKSEARAAARDVNRGPRRIQEVFVGPSAKSYYSHFEEFGTVKQAAHPFMRPAWDANKDKALDIIKTELGTEINKAAKRLAKKRAKAGL